MFLDGQEKKECCGCTACSKVCPFFAIEMKEDDMGFYYPTVDKNKCVDCGICEKVCPMRENYVGQDANPDIYAVRNHNETVLNRSSSGGMFSMLAEWVLSQEGVIYGVAFDESFYVHHTRAVSMEKASKFCSSKYVESDISHIYENVLRDLSDGYTVLLTGTPCQISGLTKFLKIKHVNTEKLYTCDNICHGVPSRKVWKTYLDILRNNYIASDDEIIYINMRSKKASWKDRVMEVRLKKGNIDEVIQKFSFNRFFQSLLGTRPSCFNCKYTSYKRISDFTLGDFWNVEQANIAFDTEGGINVVFVHTEKGRQLFEKIRQNADVQKVTKQVCWQPHLEYAAKQPISSRNSGRNLIIVKTKRM